MILSCMNCDLRLKAMFRQFTDGELADIDQLKTGQIAIPPKSDIFPSPRISGGVCTLLAGWALKYRRMPNGTRQILDFLLPGDLIGLQQALTGATEHRVQALTPVTVCVLGGAPMQDFLKRHPDMLGALTQALLVDERRYENRLAALGRLTAPQRIGYLMLEIFDRVHQLGVGDGTWVHFPLQRQHIADTLGLSGTHVNRSLAELRDRGLASLGSNMLVIQDRNALANFSCYTTLPTAGRRIIL